MRGVDEPLGAREVVVAEAGEEDERTAGHAADESLAHAAVWIWGRTRGGGGGVMADIAQVRRADAKGPRGSNEGS